MKSISIPANVLPHRVESPSGLRFELNTNGSIRRIDHGDIMLNLFLGNEMDGGLANLYLRRIGETIESIPLLGPGSPASFTFDEMGMRAYGKWRDLEFRVQLVLADSAPSWFWHVKLENQGTNTITCDVIHTQDIGLAHYGTIRLNEYYVSQYLDHAPLSHSERGHAVASRQNLSMGGRCPWSVISSLNRGVSFSTDAMQFHGFASRSGREPAALASGLPGKRLQHEHAMLAIQDAAITLAPGASAVTGFFGWFEVDKPSATCAEDIAKIDSALSLPEALPPVWSHNDSGVSSAKCLFSAAPLLESLDLKESEVRTLFGEIHRHEEHANGEIQSFFSGNGNHVVFKVKEDNVLRPHGHILRSGGSLVPDESCLTSTAWMNGVFHSMVTQGHVSINRFLSTCHTYLGNFRSHGQRVFIEVDGTWHLLGMPTVFEMGLDSCRWIYKHRDGLLEVRAVAPDNFHELRLEVQILEGPPTRFFISHHIALNGDDGSNALPALWEKKNEGVFLRAIPDSDVGRRFPDGGFFIAPMSGTVIEKIGGDELLFTDHVSRNQPFLCCITKKAKGFALSISGTLVESSVNFDTGFWDGIQSSLRIEASDESLLAIAAGRASEIFPWFVHNALVHYLSPRGLEQYSGGGWGTRDVCQGPVELLLALGQFAPIRDLLCRVFRQQNSDGDWPQWFMFFDRERNIRPGDSHGDIVYWPLLALAQYLIATGDSSLLDESLPYFHPEGDANADKASIWQHVERALELIERRVIPGTHLAAYGHGDWNDSLQPVKPDMRENLCSSWTVTLNYQTFLTLADALRRIDKLELAKVFVAKSAVILEEFQRILIVDGVIAGLAYFHPDGKNDYLIHPRDATTGLSYSVLPMIHAIINGMFTPQQAEEHLKIIKDHLLGPDGAHLFDRPMAYHGGPQKYFQRAESASYFGREIGIMYMHAHLRYCEALARFGDADAFFAALGKMIPINVRDTVLTGAPRQANCYFSSSDAAFDDRYDAYDNYERVKNDEVALEGGWRVYSSGAGIGARLIMQCFLGIRFENDALVIDPVIPSSLDGLVVYLNLMGNCVQVTYRISSKGCGPSAVSFNGAPIDFARDENPYRTGAARVAIIDIEHGLSACTPKLLIELF